MKLCTWWAAEVVAELVVGLAGHWMPLEAAEKCWSNESNLKEQTLNQRLMKHFSLNASNPLQSDPAGHKRNNSFLQVSPLCLCPGNSLTCPLNSFHLLTFHSCLCSCSFPFLWKNPCPLTYPWHSFHVFLFPQSYQLPLQLHLCCHKLRLWHHSIFVALDPNARPLLSHPSTLYPP